MCSCRDGYVKNPVNLSKDQKLFFRHFPSRNTYIYRNMVVIAEYRKLLESQSAFMLAYARSEVSGETEMV